MDIKEEGNKERERKKKKKIRQKNKKNKKKNGMRSREMRARVRARACVCGAEWVSVVLFKESWYVQLVTGSGSGLGLQPASCAAPSEREGFILFFYL